MLRKVEGLKESADREAQRFGQQALALMGMLMTAIRQHPPDAPLTKTYQAQLTAYRQLCEQMKTASHKKASALATEMLNDWEAIFGYYNFII